jgi:hypothetical protein
MMVRMATSRICFRASLFGFFLSQPVVAHGDGTLPPQPYNYRHPPPAVAKTNHGQASGALTVRLDGKHVTDKFILFTGDGQAGLGTHRGLFSFLHPPGSLASRSSQSTSRGTCPNNLWTTETHTAFRSWGSLEAVVLGSLSLSALSCAGPINRAPCTCITPGLGERCVLHPTGPSVQASFSATSRS